MGHANESFSMARYAESSPLYVSYKLVTNYTYGTLKLSSGLNGSFEAFILANFGYGSAFDRKILGYANRKRL